MNSKNLHLHALPIIFLSLSLLIVSIYEINRLEDIKATSNSSVNLLLNSHLFTIKSSSSGLFKVSRYQSQSVVGVITADGRKFSQLSSLGQSLTL